jgi:hypothetical protein
MNKLEQKEKTPDMSDVRRASEFAKRKLSEALDKKANATVSISRDGNDWTAMVEVIEEEYLPGKNVRSMNDIIGVYEVKLSSNGNLQSWLRKSSRKRGSG